MALRERVERLENSFQLRASTTHLIDLSCICLENCYYNKHNTLFSKVVQPVTYSLKRIIIYCT